jgi:hypothetical protein
MIHRLGFPWDAGGIIGDIEGTSLLFTIQRRSTKDPFGSSETEAIEALLPHLECATQIATRLALARGEGMLDAFHCMRCGGV